MPTTPGPSQHFPFVAAIRGIAALLVLVFHLQIHIFEHYPDQPIEHYSLTWWVFLGFFDLGKYAVASFFLISGFLIPATLRGPGATVRGFAVKRFFRLYPAYWFAIAFAVLVAILLGKTAEFTAPEVLANLTMVQPLFGQPDLIGVFWTLQIELAFYLVCALLAAFGGLERRTLWKYTFLACGLAAAVLRGWSGIPLPVAIPIALALMFFADGLRTRVKRLVDRTLVLEIAVLAALLVPISLFGYGDEGARYIATYWAAIATFVLAWRYADPILATSRLGGGTEFLGDISYSVYLIGIPLLGLVAAPLFAATGSRALAAAAVLAATVLLSAAVYKGIEAPAIRVGKRRGGRRAYDGPVPARVFD
jgi:peptidoglycan/LPS O-acetylase OafA/YrhL